ncbi:MAG TPA: energy-coupling factor transporter transmembrane protein EcfT [Candidatus Nitrosotenuis sp.]|nr:energy-coupling factor transporter transmembrane protein EcfT [Candidatus Nitrosotenuis sp.]
MTLGQFVPRDSALHRLDPRAKLLGLAAAVAVLFFLESWETLALAALLVAWLGALSRLPWGYLVRGLRAVWVLALLTLVFNACFGPGTRLEGAEGLPVTAEGLRRGGLLAARLLLLVALTSLLTLTTSPIALTDGVEKLLTPLRWVGLPSHDLAMVTTIALRFVPTLALEAEKIMKAQMARGAAIDQGGPLRRARAMVPVLVPLFVSAFRHAEDLAVAMEARCYRGGRGRTRLRQLRMGAADWLALLFWLAALGGLVSLRWLP